MNSILPEIANPITSARVVGDDVTYEEYSHQVVDRGHRDYRMGRSDLLDFARCPHKWLVGYTSEDTEATEWGQLFEAIVIYPDRVKDNFAVCPETYPDKKTGEAKPWTFAALYCKAWREDQGKKQIVKGETFTQAQNAAKFFFARPELARFVKSSRKQVMVEGTWEDKETAMTIPLKGLIDLVPSAESFPDSLGDIKTTRSAEPRTWSRDVFQYGLHVQAALYLDLWNKATGQQRTTFHHLISESGPPWEPAQRILSQDFVTLGRMTYVEILKRYSRSLKDGNWSGYDTDEAGTVWQGWLITEPEAWMMK